MKEKRPVCRENFKLFMELQNRAKKFEKMEGKKKNCYIFIVFYDRYLYLNDCLSMDVCS